jgi:hypothetical protein
MYQLCYVNIFSANQNEHLVLLDDPGRVRSQIIRVVCQIQRFDFDCNLVKIDAKINNMDTVALIEFASSSLHTKVHLKKKSGGRKTRR